MKRKTLTIIACVLAGALILSVTFYAGRAYAASLYGTREDPLVTLSYLTDKLAPSLLEQFDDSLGTAVQELKDEIKGGGGVTTTYKLITLQSGQTLTGQTGTEILLRDGSLTLQGNSSMVDTTDARSVDVGATLVVNHLCMFASDGGQVKASTTTNLLVRGSYTVG